MGKREISPAVGMSPDNFLELVGEPLRSIVFRIRAEKDAGTRLLPSETLLDHSAMLTPNKRGALLNKVAEMVDENLGGRSEMCLQYAKLLDLALRHLGFTSYAVAGMATYFNAKGKRVFEWEHAWVRVGREIVDGNTDSMRENVMVPTTVNAAPYWGPLDRAPGRTFRQGSNVDADSDVENIWWPELKDWLENEFSGIR